MSLAKKTNVLLLDTHFTIATLASSLRDITAASLGIVPGGKKGRIIKPASWVKTRVNKNRSHAATVRRCQSRTSAMQQHFPLRVSATPMVPPTVSISSPFAAQLREPRAVGLLPLCPKTQSIVSKNTIIVFEHDKNTIPNTIRNTIFLRKNTITASKNTLK